MQLWCGLDLKWHRDRALLNAAKPDNGYRRIARLAFLSSLRKRMVFGARLCQAVPCLPCAGGKSCTLGFGDQKAPMSASYSFVRIAPGPGCGLGETYGTNRSVGNMM